MTKTSKDELVQRIAAKAVIEYDGSILALHPSSIDPNKKWHIPGGIRDNINEPLHKTAVREVYEETGIDLTNVPNKVIKIGEWKAVDKEEKVKILGVFFHFKLSKKPTVTISQEHDQHAWLNLDNYHKYKINEDLKESIELGLSNN